MTNTLFQEQIPSITPPTIIPMSPTSHRFPIPDDQGHFSIVNSVIAHSKADLMANIITIDQVRAKRERDRAPSVAPSAFRGPVRTVAPAAPAPAAPASPFQGHGRRLDGVAVPAAPTPPPAPHPTDLEDGEVPANVQIVVIKPPREIAGEFWSQNSAPMLQFNVAEFCKRSYCPCFVGPCCNDVRRGDWLRLLRMATFWILVAQLAIYIATVSLSRDFGWMLDPDVDVLLDFGANSRERLQCRGHYHRLLAYILLHGSWFHILFNGLSEWLFVLAMENAWGHWRFLVIYIASGVTGGLLSNVRSLNVSVGASCSIFGVMGANAVLIVMFWPSIEDVFKQHFIFQLAMVPVLFVAVSFLPNVDWLGHLGGLIGGIGLGALVFVRKAQEAHRKRYIVLGAALLVILIVVCFCVIYLTGDCRK
jgi:rhomboid protease GluP